MSPYIYIYYPKQIGLTERTVTHGSKKIFETSTLSQGGILKNSIINFYLLRIKYFDAVDFLNVRGCAVPPCFD